MQMFRSNLAWRLTETEREIAAAATETTAAESTTEVGVATGVLEELPEHLLWINICRKYKIKIISFTPVWK